MNSISRTLITGLIALAVALALAPSTSAQDDENIGKGRKRIEEVRRVKIIEALDLNEEQAVRLFVREKEFRKAEQALNEKREATIERMRSLVKGGSDADIQKEVEALSAIGSDMLQKRMDYVLGLKDVLSMQQIAKLIVFEDTFRRELRDILREARPRQGFRK